MESAVFYDRLQFAVTATFHYLFPQLTMGLALLLLYFRTRALVIGDGHYQRGGEVLDQDLWPQFRVRRRHRHPAGIPVRHELGQVLQRCGRRYRPNP